MRGTWCALSVCLVLAVGAARADEQADMKALVEKAIKAAGGEAKLEKLQTANVKVKATVTEGDQEATIAFEGVCQGFDQYKMEMEFTGGGRTHKGVLVINGDKGWAKEDGKDNVKEAPKDVLEAITASLYALRLSQMLTHLKDKEYTLSPLGEVKVNDRPALGVKVTRKGRPDANLYFDKETNLPVKCEVRGKDPKSGQEANFALTLSDHKEADGVKLARKAAFTLDDKKLMEAELTEIKPADKQDEKTFAKPE